MLTALFIFAMFFIAYVLWCRHTYWRMRMDMAADATALSAMRDEAAMLNTIGTLQYLENFLLQKVKIIDKDYPGVELYAVKPFTIYNTVMKRYVDYWYTADTLGVAQYVAKANGADILPVPIPPPQHHLLAQDRDVYLLDGPTPICYGIGWPPPCLTKHYDAAYYYRDWWPNETAPQPPHRETWIVCYDGICEKGKARLWLDVKESSQVNDGGFPTEHLSFIRSIGLQCNYPQFNARLMPKN